MPLHCIQDKASSFERLLEKDGSVTTHTRNCKILVTEMFKVHKTPAIIADLFRIRQNNYNMGHNSYFGIPNVKFSNLSIMLPNVCQVWDLEYGI